MTRILSRALLLVALAIPLAAEIVFDSSAVPAPFYLDRQEARPRDIDIRWNITIRNGLGTVPGPFCAYGRPFPVDAESTYRLSGEFRVLNASAPIRNFHFGFQARDKENRAIFIHEVYVAKEAIGTLAEDAMDGDTQLFFEPIDWTVPYPHWVLAFDAKEDLSDLPNRDCSARIVKDSQRDEGASLSLRLSRPIRKSYPAGTKVRLHADGATYLYVGNGPQPSGEWVQWSGVIRGIHPKGKVGPRSWYVGTTQANVIFRCFDAGMQGATFEFRNIRVERIPTPAAK